MIFIFNILQTAISQTIFITYIVKNFSSIVSDDRGEFCLYNAIVLCDKMICWGGKLGEDGGGTVAKCHKI